MMYGEQKMDGELADERRLDIKKVMDNKARIELENIILKKQIERI